MIDGVDIGTAVVAYIEPHEGAAREFNRWYERDHFYAAALAGPGAFAGARFVATRACKAARPPRGTLFGDPDRGSYLALYWLLPDAQEEWSAWTARQVEMLAPQGRMFAGRDHLHTASYRFVCERGAPHAALALDRNFAGVVTIAIGHDDDVPVFLDALVGPCVPVAAVFEEERLIMSVLGDDAVTDPQSHLLVVGFVDGDVMTTWREHVAPMLDRTPASVRYASPFLATIPGTDTYVDEL
jgi:hypothetical protein